MTSHTHKRLPAPNGDDAVLKDILTDIVKAYVAEDLAEKVRRGEVVLVRTEPNETRVYQKVNERAQ